MRVRVTSKGSNAKSFAVTCVSSRTGRVRIKVRVRVRVGVRVRVRVRIMVSAVI